MLRDTFRGKKWLQLLTLNLLASSAWAAGTEIVVDVGDIDGSQGFMVPSMEQIESELPEGMSIDELGLNMTGQATAGSLNRWQTHEWTLTYLVQIDAEGTRVDDKWLDPRAGQ